MLETTWWNTRDFKQLLAHYIYNHNHSVNLEYCFVFYSSGYLARTARNLPDRVTARLALVSLGLLTECPADPVTLEAITAVSRRKMSRQDCLSVCREYEMKARRHYQQTTAFHTEDSLRFFIFPLMAAVANPENSSLLAQFFRDLVAIPGLEIFRCLSRGAYNGNDRVYLQKHWLTRDVVGMAYNIHDNEEWGDLPMLADALADAGCDEPRLIHGLLGHTYCLSRGWVAQEWPIPRRGSWVLDVLLGIQ